MLNRFHGARLEIKEAHQNDGEDLSALYEFTSTNFPKYLKSINDWITQTTKTFDDFKSILQDKLSISINIELGETIKESEL